VRARTVKNCVIANTLLDIYGYANSVHLFINRFTAIRGKDARAVVELTVQAWCKGIKSIFVASGETIRIHKIIIVRVFVCIKELASRPAFNLEMYPTKLYDVY